MIRSYFKIAWRNLVRNKTYSLLNIIGLSAGLTCFSFIALWVADEVSYDRFNTNYDRIVRLTGIAKTETGVEESAVSSAPMAKALKESYPEVENAVRMDLREELINHKGQQFLQPGILVADPSFFDVFSYKLTTGDQATALSEPYSVILTVSTAKKYFGDANPIGQTLIIYMADSTGRGAPYKVTGLMPDPPQNAHFTFNMLASFKTLEVFSPSILTIDGWGDGSYYTYLLLRKDVDHKAFSAKISQFYAKYIGDRFNAWRSIYFYKLQPLADIHLRSNLQYEIAPTGNINQVYIFSTIGIFILLLAGINYMNLATARSVSRAREVGVKKVVGAGKRQLVFQYLLEAVLTAMVALLISILISSLLQPFFYEVSGKSLQLFSSPALILFLTLVTVFLGTLSGIYPAIIFSGFKPVRVLKGSFASGSKGVFLRKSLVVSQFIITLILITGIVVVYAQMSYIKHKDLGYKKDALLFLRVHGNSDVMNGYAAFKNELLNSSLVSGVAISNSLPVGGLGSGGAETVDINNMPLTVNTSRLRVDENYLNVYGIKLIAGKNFTPNARADSILQIILNEEAVKKFGWKTADFAIGKSFKMGNQTGYITGVVKNFHFNSLQETIDPLAIYPVSQRFSRITLKVDEDKIQEAIKWAGAKWKKYFPQALLDYDFVDKLVGDQYRAEERFSRIFLCFSVLSLLIACLGLYGLIAYTTVQKTKEIGIRKVLGATAQGIAGMLSWSFLKLILFASLIAVPVAWYAMNNWLEDFAYRVELTWWMFVIGGSIVLLIALITVGFQAIKAAVANPVKSLRSE